MSQSIDEPNGDVTQGQNLNGEGNGTSNGDDQSSGHPAWQEILDILPDEALRTIIKPHLQKWDDGVQTRFQNLQSSYAPYKDFVDQEVDPEYINQAIGLAAAIEEQPERVLSALKEAYPDVWAQMAGQGVADSGSGSADSVDTDEEVEPWEAKYNEMASMMEQMAGVFLADQNSREATDEDAALDEYLVALHGAYDATGGFDEKYVLQQIAEGVDGQVAVEQFRAVVKQFGGGAVSSSSAPPVLGGGGTPSNQQPLPTDSNANTVDLVKQLLEAANKET